MRKKKIKERKARDKKRYYFKAADKQNIRILAERLG